MNRSQFKELEGIISFFDNDGDGNISSAELRSCLKKTVGEDLSAEDAEDLIRSLDVNGDGVLSLNELVSKLSETRTEEEEMEHLREAFRMYENDGEGFITANSLNRMLGRLGMSKEMDQCKNMIGKFDSNGDGVLCFEEFKEMMMIPTPDKGPLIVRPSTDIQRRSPEPIEDPSPEIRQKEEAPASKANPRGGNCFHYQLPTKASSAAARQRVVSSGPGSARPRPSEKGSGFGFQSKNQHRAPLPASKARVQRGVPISAAGGGEARRRPPAAPCNFDGRSCASLHCQSRAVNAD